MLPTLILNSSIYEFRVPWYPRELVQLQCKPRDQGMQSQMHPKVLAAPWMQLDVFGGHPHLENALCIFTCTHSTEIVLEKPSKHKGHGRKMSK